MSESVTVDVHLEEDSVQERFDREIREGLSADPPWISSKFFYDERGSELFEKITRQPEYYLTRTEQQLLDRYSERIAEVTREIELVELGAGAAKKTRRLIETSRTAGHLERYIPIEVSEEFARQSARRLAELYPDLDIHVVVGDFTQHLWKVPRCRRPLVALLGSTLGNFPEDEAIDLLRQVPSVLGDDGHLLLGLDLVKSTERLEAAYNDRAGVTVAFNRNILNVVNRQVDGDFDPLAFDHRARYSAERERIESSLVANRDQRVGLAGIDLTLDLAEGDAINTEISRKYTRVSAERILTAAGLRIVEWITDDEALYALALARCA